MEVLRAGVPRSLYQGDTGRAIPSCEVLLSAGICPGIQVVSTLSCFPAHERAQGRFSVDYFYL